jgi:peptidoglycan/LPS O-acetylase OafA/YrhL
VAFGIGVSFAIAFASWHLFEKRILGLKRFFPYERQRTLQRSTLPEPVVAVAPGADLGSLSSSAPPRAASQALIREGSSGR